MKIALNLIKFALKVVKGGVELALKLLPTVLNKIVKVCKENKELLTQLSKLAAKVVTRGHAISTATSTKFAMKFAAEKTASQSAKTILKFTNPAGMVADVAQAGFEITGYKEIGRQVGLWGNFGAGLVAGVAVGGPVGAPIGALVGLGTWVIGEAVGETIEEILS